MIQSSNASFDEVGFSSLIRDMERAYLLLSELGVEGGDSNTSTVLRFDGGGMLPAAFNYNAPAYGGNGNGQSLQKTGVTAGSYTNANITVDEFGRITNVQNGSGGGLANLPDPIVNVNGYISTYSSYPSVWTANCKYNSIKIDYTDTRTSYNCYSELTDSKLDIVRNVSYTDMYRARYGYWGITIESSTYANPTMVLSGNTSDPSNVFSLEYNYNYSKQLLIKNKENSISSLINMGYGKINCVKNVNGTTINTNVCDVATITTNSSVPTEVGTRGQLYFIV